LKKKPKIPFTSTLLRNVAQKHNITVAKKFSDSWINVPYKFKCIIKLPKNGQNSENDDYANKLSEKIMKYYKKI
jgi:hypothetical protein